MICFNWCATSEVAFTLPQRIIYDVRARDFGTTGKPVHVAWYLLRCSRCPRAFLLKGTDEIPFRLAIESYVQSQGWLLKAPYLYCDSQELMLICPDCVTTDDCPCNRID